MKTVPKMKVSVLDVDRSNFADSWNFISQLVSTSSFIAIDLELSGLGSKQKLNAVSVEERYTGMCEAAMSRSIISLGLAFFQEEPEPTKSSTPLLTSSSSSSSFSSTPLVMASFRVHVVNLFLLCSEEYTVEPSALQFLVDHHFDFNRQYSKGVSYRRGADKSTEPLSVVSVRNLFSWLVLSRKPLVLHNGLVDLVYLYGNLYESLPSTLGSFVCDLLEMFPGGIYDTKFISDYKLHVKVSFLEYIFKKSQLLNRESSNAKRVVSITMGDYPVACTLHEELIRDLVADNTLDSLDFSRLCPIYEMFGYCHGKPSACTGVHSVDLLLAKENSSRPQAALSEYKPMRNHKKRPRHGNRVTEPSMGSHPPTDDVYEDASRTADLTVHNSDESRNHSTMYSALDSAGPIKKTITEDGTELARKTAMEGGAELARKTAMEDGAELAKKTITEDGTELSRKTAMEDGAKLAKITAMEDGTELARKTAMEDGAEVPRTNGHRAGYDAFMTGYCFAVACCYLTGKCPENSVVNKLFLSGKDLPLMLAKSSFSKSSPQHVSKLRRLQSFGQQ